MGMLTKGAAFYGAATGATIGSVAGPVGTAVGAAVGAAVGGGAVAVVKKAVEIAYPNETRQYKESEEYKQLKDWQK